ncbi:methionine adenosyltransferase domain-containing protein, partial [Escherichia sp. TWPC-MK]
MDGYFRSILHPIYKETAAYGHFGREHFPWE